MYSPNYRNAPTTYPRGMIRLVLLKGSCGASCGEPIEPADGCEVVVAEVGLWSLGVLDVAPTLGHPADVKALTKTQNVATPRERSHVITRCREGRVGLPRLDRKRLNGALHGMCCIAMPQSIGSNNAPRREKSLEVNRHDPSNANDSAFEPRTAFCHPWARR